MAKESSETSLNKMEALWQTSITTGSRWKSKLRSKAESIKSKKLITLESQYTRVTITFEHSPWLGRPSQTKR